MPRTLLKHVRDGMIVDEKQTISIATHPENLPEELAADDRDLKLLMDSAVTPDDWLDIFRTAKSMSLSGNVKAMEFLAKYRWGLPAQMIAATIGNARITVIEVVRPNVVPIAELEKPSQPPTGQPKLEDDKENDATVPL